MKATVAVIAAILCVIALLYVATAPTPPAEMTEAEREAIVAEVEVWLGDFGEAWESLDLDRAFALNVQTPEFTWAGSGSITRGFDTWAELTRAGYSSVESVDWRPTDNHIVVLSQDAVVVLDVGTVVGSNAEGVFPEEPYSYTWVLVRRDGEWKLLLAHG